MPRRYRRRRSYYPIMRKKYSFEHYNFVQTFTVAESSNLDAKALIVAPAGTLGTRKVKNFTLNICVAADIPILFALVYVPEGTEPNSLTYGGTVVDNVVTTSSLYEPNQNVIMSGIIPANNAAKSTYISRMARNLNSNDRIMLVFGSDIQSTSENTYNFACEVSYCIAF